MNGRTRSLLEPRKWATGRRRGPQKLSSKAPGARSAGLRDRLSDIGQEPKSFLLGLDRLSTDWRALVGLYTMLHAAVGGDRTLCIDGPDDDVPLRGIRPWLVELTDKVRATDGRCLLISHHPEPIDDLAPKSGVRSFREGVGPVRMRPSESAFGETKRIEWALDRASS